MPEQPASLAQLLDELYLKQTVLGGWIAALSISEAAVQRLALSQWPVAAQLSVSSTVTSAQHYRLDFNVDAPSFSLVLTGSAVKFVQPVRAVSLAQGQATGQPVSLTGSAAISGTVPLRLVSDPTGSTKQVLALDLTAASITHQGLENTGIDARDLATQIGGAIATAKSQIALASFDLAPGATASAVQPASLQFSLAASTAGAPVLQLLIGGPKGAPATTKIDVSAPVPTSDGCDYALLVDSSAIIQEIVSQYNTQKGFLKLVAVTPALGSGQDEAPAAAYAQTRNPFQFQSSITCGKVIQPINSSASMGMAFKGSTDSGLVVGGYALPGGTLALELQVAGSFPLQVAEGGTLRFSSQDIQVTANGVAENTVKPRLNYFLVSEVAPNLANVSFASSTGLLLQRLSLPGLQPKIVHAQLPADLLLAGTFEPSAST